MCAAEIPDYLHHFRKSMWLFGCLNARGFQTTSFQTKKKLATGQSQVATRQTSSLLSIQIFSKNNKNVHIAKKQKLFLRSILWQGRVVSFCSSSSSCSLNEWSFKWSNIAKSIGFRSGKCGENAGYIPKYKKWANLFCVISDYWEKMFMDWSLEVSTSSSYIYFILFTLPVCTNLLIISLIWTTNGAYSSRSILNSSFSNCSFQ